MSNNREKRIYKEYVYLYLALQREGTAKDKKCIRQVIKDEELDLKIIEAKCKVMGGTWRIHKTVNARNCEKARKILLKRLVDHPEKASVIDSEWRTALMQRECKATNYFMLDVDTQNSKEINIFADLLEEEEFEYINNKKSTGDKRLVLHVTQSPKGYHFITEKFDTREILKLNYVTLLRDGYYYVKTVGEKLK